MSIPANETNLVKACLSWLSLHGIYAWRQNTGAVRVAKRFVRFGEPGAADITGIIGPNGVRLEIECKSWTGVQTAKQRIFGEAIRRSGGVYLVVHDLEELEAGIRECHDDGRGA